MGRRGAQAPAPRGVAGACRTADGAALRLRREDLDSIRVVTSGTAPLSAEDADAFSEKYGIPVLTSYAATEFGGGVAGWTLPITTANTSSISPR